MTNKERFYATIERQPVDRPASWLGLPVAESEKKLLQFFGVDSINKIKIILDDDIWPVEVPYKHPPINHIACAFDFAKKLPGYEERTLTEPGFFENYFDSAAVSDFPWPDPANHIDHEQCIKALEVLPENRALMGMMWSAHFQDACAAFGMENALMKMLLEPEMFRAVIERITKFYLDANRIFYEAGKGKLDAVLLGNDMGSQAGLMMSPDQFREFVLPGIRQLVDQAKSYDLKVIYHSCGAIYDIIPDLIATGVDAIHPIQALATNMEPEKLKSSFGAEVSFCGGVDVQELLVNGSPDEVRDKVRQLKTLFSTGLIISPSHEAILPDVAPENIQAMFDAIKESHYHCDNRI